MSKISKISHIELLEELRNRIKKGEIVLTPATDCSRDKAIIATYVSGEDLNFTIIQNDWKQMPGEKIVLTKFKNYYELKTLNQLKYGS